MQTVIEMQNIKKYYATGEAQVKALDGIDLSIRQGEFLAIVGRSGSGKSTLMNILGCLDLPTEGRYLLNGEAVDALSAKRLSDLRNQYIGFVFQRFHLLPTMTALENVELPLLYAGVGRAERRAAAIAMLERVGLAERMHHLPGEMSGGQQQRVAIARAAVTRPTVLLADEPTGNLDASSGREVMQLLHTLHDDGTTIVLITHDLQVAAEASRQAEMQAGKLRQTPEKLRKTVDKSSC